MKQIRKASEYKTMTANFIRKEYKSGKHVWRCIDDCIALINNNENVRKCLENIEVDIGDGKMQKIGSLDRVFCSYGTVHQQIKCIAYILGEDYEKIRKACWSMVFKELLVKDTEYGNFNPYMAMGTPDMHTFQNTWVYADSKENKITS